MTRSAQLMRLAIALGVLYVVATALHIGYVVAHEPFVFDAWNVAEKTRGEPATLGRWLEFWWTEYTQSNPRLGQSFTYLAYKLAWFYELAAPLAYLGLGLAITVLGLGRFPRHRDWVLVVVALGLGWCVLPELGRNLFNRAYGANYVIGAAIQVWFLATLRLAARAEDAPVGRMLTLGGFGLVAGLCHEHTGPAILGFVIGWLWWTRRQPDRNPRLVLAGAAGFALGFCALFFAPGQDDRYDGLATRVSLPMRALQRGAVNNLDILRDALVHAAPLLALTVIVLAVASRGAPEPLRGSDRQAALGRVLLALGFGLAVAVTLFASPKLGARFFIVPQAVLLGACLGLVELVLQRPRQLLPLVGIAVAASIYAAARTIPLYTRLAAQSAARMAELTTADPGAVVAVEALEQIDESWWYIGDDFRDPRKRDLVASYRGLARVHVRADDQRAPLGVSGVTVPARYWISGASCPQVSDEFDLRGTRPFDRAAIARTLELVRARHAPATLERLELAVEFTGPRPALPRERLFVARYEDGQLEAYTAAIARQGATRTRTVVPGPELAGKPMEIYIYQVGTTFTRLGVAGEGPLRFVPWRTGIYWALACDTAECWVIAATRAHGS